MNLLFLTVGDETVASSRARVYGYLPYLKKKLIRYKLLSYASRHKSKRVINLKEDNFLQKIAEITRKAYIVISLFILALLSDIIFVQKAILPKPLWKILKALNKRIIFDFDDAIYLSKDIGYILKDAACVIVSNSYLGKFAAKFNRKVYEIPTPVSISRPVEWKVGKTVTLGWVGSPETSGYLQLLLPVFKKLKEDFRDLDIEFMGARPANEFESLGVKFTDWSLWGEGEYLERINIGIMPLRDDEWSKSKAGYKLLLYMSKGIPAVASPVGVNKEIMEDGVTGFFAVSEKDWLEKLSILLLQRERARKMGEAARLRANRYFSYESVFPKFLEAVNSCLFASPEDPAPLA